MKTGTVTEFKTHCHEFLNEVGCAGEAIILTRRGKPCAMVSSPPVEEPKVFVMGQFKDRGWIIGDALEPFDEEWAALSEDVFPS